MMTVEIMLETINRLCATNKATEPSVKRSAYYYLFERIKAYNPRIGSICFFFLYKFGELRDYNNKLYTIVFLTYTQFRKL
jgi:hypothetical protein